MPEIRSRFKKNGVLLEYNLGGYSSLSQGHTETRSSTLTLTPRDNLPPMNLTCMFLGGGRRPKYLERTHAYTGRTCKLQLGIEPGSLLLWGDGANHHTTVQLLLLLGLIKIIYQVGSQSNWMDWTNLAIAAEWTSIVFWGLFTLISVVVWIISLSFIQQVWHKTRHLFVKLDVI